MVRGEAPAVAGVGHAQFGFGAHRDGPVPEGRFEDLVGPFEPAVGLLGAALLGEVVAARVADRPVRAVDDDRLGREQGGEACARRGEGPVRGQLEVVGDRFESNAVRYGLPA